MNVKDILLKVPIFRSIIFNILYAQRRKMQKEANLLKIGSGTEICYKDIYIIKFDNSSAGLFAFVLFALGEIEFALRENMIPVMDMCTYKNSYLYEEEVGYVNAWNYYFKNLGEISLEDSKKFSNVFISSYSGERYNPEPSVGWMKNKKEIHRWQQLSKNNLFLNDEIKMYCENSKDLLLQNNARVLGVKCRGTDYNAITAKNHPIQPPVICVIKKAYQVMEKYNCSKIYLSCEDKAIIKQFKNEFGDKLLITDSIRVNYDVNKQQYITLSDTKRNNDKYLQGLEYLRDEYILATCNCLIGGINGGTAGALVLGKDYEYTYFWYMGRY